MISLYVIHIFTILVLVGPDIVCIRIDIPNDIGHYIAIMIHHYTNDEVRELFL